jgi:hypothetical protein
LGDHQRSEGKQGIEEDICGDSDIWKLIFYDNLVIVTGYFYSKKLKPSTPFLTSYKGTLV